MNKNETGHGRSAHTSAAALELGNLLSRWVENRYQSADCDEWQRTAERQANDTKGRTAIERRKSADAAQYFAGQSYGIMNERLLIEDLMAELGLVDTYQLSLREFTATNANKKGTGEVSDFMPGCGYTDEG